MGEDLRTTGASAAQARDRICEALRLDLVGPGPQDGDLAHEELRQRPSHWYLTGFLVPEDARTPDDPAQEEELDTGAEPAGTDEAEGSERTAARVRLLPSSIGLSCLLRPETREVRVRVSWGEYRREDAPPADAGAEEEADADPENGGIWRREPHGWEGDIAIGAGSDGSLPIAEGVELRWLCRETRNAGRPALLLSLFLTNRREPQQKLKDETYLFQPQIEIASDALTGRADPRRPLEEDADERIAALHYRDVVEWATGHGIAAEPVGDPDGRVRGVRTTWLPTVEVERVVPNRRIRGTFAAEELGRLDAGAVEAALGPLAEDYRAWLQRERGRIGTLPEEHRGTATELVEAGERALSRIEAGIARLQKDSAALEAFRSANRAVDEAFRRRRARERGSDQERKSGLVWHPFQLAFVLLNLEGLCAPDAADREIVDLLFFPTGGGKTEAYLALAAFAMVRRRLAYGEPRGLGLSVLMRYTLRLLTLDQLLRASAVVCALELERRRAPERLGHWPFEIGLWVGRAATPNRLGGPNDRDPTTAYERVMQYVDGNTRDLPVPIDGCPWCGTAFDRESFLLGHYVRDGNGHRFVRHRSEVTDLRLRCANPECDFDGSQGYLPILTVDDAIYRRLPAFVVATVDKFASLPWEKRTGALLGRVGHFDPVDGFAPEPPPAGEELVEPPDLVIQDELHLVSGPLGTLVGLYETAIEAIAGSRRADGRPVRPKIVASTATARRAAEQVRRLYGRARTELFPPPGIDRGDSFFAEVARKEEGGRRRYLAVAAPGVGAKRVFLRTVSSLLAAAEAARQALGDEAADPYLTVVGYFNALRELGSARRIVEGEILGALQRYGARDRGGRGLVADRHDLGEPLELTSRVGTAEVAEARRRLAASYGARGFVDVALATNMISVGLDITRLGLMVVAGQPKSAAEYIQATSRVGRDPERPGLVVVLPNLHKPRDRSHLEHFEVYHRSFYRAVEAQSVTPFAVGALDRGLAAVLVALARHLDPELWDEQQVGNIAELERFLPTIREILVDRLRRCDLDGEVEEELDRRLQRLVDAWKAVADRTPDLSYAERPRQGIERLLRDVLEPGLEADQALFRAPRSLRDVEPNAWLRVLRPDFRALPGEGDA